MKAIYPDQDANSITRMILQSMISRGYQEEVRGSLLLLQSIEESVFESVRHWWGLFDSREYLALLKALRSLPEIDEDTELIIIVLMKEYAGRPKETEELVREVLGNFLYMLCGDRERFVFSYPVNLLAAMNTLFNVTLLKKMMLNSVSFTFEEVLDCDEVAFVDSIGVHFVPDEDEYNRARGDFLHLLKLIVERWSLHRFFTGDRSETIPPMSELLESPGQIQKRKVAELVKPMSSVLIGT